MKLVNGYCIPENSIQSKSKFIPIESDLINLGFTPDGIGNYYISNHEGPYLFGIGYEEGKFYVGRGFIRDSYTKIYANIKSLIELKAFVSIFHTNNLIDNFEI